MKKDELTVEYVAAQAYQVIAAIGSDDQWNNSSEFLRALDYFSAVANGEDPRQDILPFDPSK